MSDRPTQGPDNSQMMRVWGIGMDFVFSVGGMGVIGWLLDLWWNTSPWALLTCLLLGLVTGFTRFLREAHAANRRMTAEFERRRGGGAE